MIRFEGRDEDGPSLQDAEALVRSLVGVAAVRIITAPDGALREIVVVPESEAAGRRVSRNVTSALMARFGVDLDPETISIATDPADTVDSNESSSPSTRQASDPAGHGRTAHDTDRQNGRSATSAGLPTSGGRPGNRTAGLAQNGIAHADAGESPAAQHSDSWPVAAARSGPNALGPVRPRLELAEIGRIADNLRCRIVVAAGTERFVGVGDGEDATITDIELAGRVAVDALRAARTPRDPIQFDGAAIVDIAGRAHVATSLSVWTGTDFRTIAGAAPIVGSPAESAARAVIDSIVANLIA